MPGTDTEVLLSSYGAAPVSARDSGKSLVDCTISRTRSSYTHSFVDWDSA